MRASRRVDDRDWGRETSLHPPLSPKAPLFFWVVSAVALVGLVLGFVRGPGPLDDPSQGHQRPGLLVDAEEARHVHALGLPGGPVGRRPVVVIFDRRIAPREELRKFVREVPDGFAVALVVPDAKRAATRLPSRVRVAEDSEGRVATRIGMRRPADGGPPVGYAVIDDMARVRYATLDPDYAEHGFEVHIVAGRLQ